MANPHGADAEDTEAIRAVLSGNRDAFRRLVDKHARSIFNLAYRMTSNAADAEDLTQESFLQAYAQLQAFRLDSPFHPWIYTIALNLCRSRLRKRLPWRWLSLAQGREQDRPAPAEPPARSPDPEQRMLAQEADECLGKAIEALPPKYREVFVLRQSQGLSYEEIARLLGLPLGTVEARLFRARRRLLDSLEASGFKPLKTRAK